MDVRRAGPDDVDDLARLVWQFASPAEQARQAVESFAADLAAWWPQLAPRGPALVADADTGPPAREVERQPDPRQKKSSSAW